MIKKLLETLENKLGKGAFLFKEIEGDMHLTLNEFTIMLKDLGKSLIFLGKIGKLDLVSMDEECWRLLGAANFLGQGTGEGVISLSGEEELFLRLEIKQPLRAEDLVDPLELLLNLMQFWRNRLEKKLLLELEKG